MITSASFKIICKMLLEIIAIFMFLALIQQIYIAYKNVGHNPIVAQGKIYDKTLVSIYDLDTFILSCESYELESTGKISEDGFGYIRNGTLVSGECPDEVAKRKMTLEEKEKEIAKIVDYYKTTFRYKMTNFFLKLNGGDILAENEITREFIKKLDEAQHQAWKDYLIKTGQAERYPHVFKDDNGSFKK